MRVSLNVGGTSFETTSETLTKDGVTFFVRVLQSDLPNIFIDRDPTHFRIILNFLRDKTCVLPTSCTGRQELAQEAHFYGISRHERMLALSETNDPSSNALSSIASTLERRM